MMIKRIWERLTGSEQRKQREQFEEITRSMQAMPPLCTIVKTGPTLAEKIADCEARLARAKRNKKRHSHIACELEGLYQQRFVNQFAREYLKTAFTSQYPGGTRR